MAAAGKCHKAGLFPQCIEFFPCNCCPVLYLRGEMEMVNVKLEDIEEIKVKKTRASKPKVKTGCQTCKFVLFSVR